MNGKEIWRIVPSVAGLLASSHGRIMVAPYITTLPSGAVRQYGGEPTAGQWDGRRFVYFTGGKTLKVHRLVCEAFNGRVPEGKNVCMHLDEDSRNNRPENLAWGTQRENLNAPGFLAYCRSRVGNNSTKAKARIERSI